MGFGGFGPDAAWFSAHWHSDTACVRVCQRSEVKKAEIVRVFRCVKYSQIITFDLKIVLILQIKTSESIAQV